MICSYLMVFDTDLCDALGVVHGFNHYFSCFSLVDTIFYVNIVLRLPLFANRFIETISRL